MKKLSLLKQKLATERDSIMNEMKQMENQINEA